jgi:hypothetical protein
MNQKAGCLHANTEYRVYPTTVGQQLRCASVKMPTHVTSNEFSGLRLRGTVDTALLQRAIAEVVKCHDAFRTDFAYVDGEYVQRVWPHAELPIRYIDLQHLPETQRLAMLLQEQQLEIRTALDISRAPLARILLVQMQQDELIVAMAVDHLIIDTLSMGVFWHDLFAAYTALLNGTDLPAPPPRQFGDYTTWQHARLTEQHIEKLQAYWRKALAGLSAPIRWRNGRPRPARFTYRSRAIGATFDAATTAGLKRFAAITGTNLFAVLNAFYVTAIAQLSDGRDILVQTGVANRRRAEFDRVIGFFAQPALLRFRITDGVSVGELVRHCHRVALEAIVYCELHPALNRALVRPPDESYAYRQQISHLHYSFIRPETLQAPGLRVPPEVLAVEEQDLPWSHDLALCSYLAGDGMDLQLWYNTGIFDASSAQEVLDELCSLGARCASSRLDENTVIQLRSELAHSA